MPIRFYTQLHLRTDLPLASPSPSDADYRDFVVSRPFVFRWRDGVYCFPADNRTDGASIPECRWDNEGSPYTGRYRRAFPGHDGSYRGSLLRFAGTVEEFEALALTSSDCSTEMHAVQVAEDPAMWTVDRMSRKDADRMFREISLWDGTGGYKALKMWWTIRRFGGGSWKGTDDG